MGAIFTVFVGIFGGLPSIASVMIIRSRPFVGTDVGIAGGGELGGRWKSSARTMAGTDRVGRSPSSSSHSSSCGAATGGGGSGAGFLSFIAPHLATAPGPRKTGAVTRSGQRRYGFVGSIGRSGAVPPFGLSAGFAGRVGGVGCGMLGGERRTGGAGR